MNKPTNRAPWLIKPWRWGEKQSPNAIIGLFIGAARTAVSRRKWAARINRCSPCEFINQSVLSSFHKGVMDHQFASSSVSSLAATLRALLNFKNRLARHSQCQEMLNTKQCPPPPPHPSIPHFAQIPAPKWRIRELLSLCFEDS